jgi:hypothetical protein
MRQTPQVGRTRETTQTDIQYPKVRIPLGTVQQEMIHLIPPNTRRIDPKLRVHSRTNIPNHPWRLLLSCNPCDGTRNSPVGLETHYPIKSLTTITHNSLDDLIRNLKGKEQDSRARDLRIATQTVACIPIDTTPLITGPAPFRAPVSSDTWITVFETSFDI